MLRTSQSHLETEERLCPIPLAIQLQDSKLCLDGSFSSGSNCSNLLAIDTGDQKGAGEEHSKGSFYITPLKGWQKHPGNIPPSKERHDNFQLLAFQCVYSSCVSANEAEAKTKLRWWHFHGRAQISLVGVATIDLSSPRWEYVVNCNT